MHFAEVGFIGWLLITETVKKIFILLDALDTHQISFAGPGAPDGPSEWPENYWKR